MLSNRLPVRYSQDEQTVTLNRVDQRVPELPDQRLTDARVNLFTRFGELCDDSSGPPNFGEEASTQPLDSQLKVADLNQQLGFCCLHE
jgi:hypothetical protein